MGFSADRAAATPLAGAAAAISGALPDYAELHCLSDYSFLRGAAEPEELVARAHALGYAALAITDECSVAGIVRAHVEAKRRGLRLLVGSEFALLAADGRVALRLVAIARDREGYGNLCEWITLGRSRAGKGGYRLAPRDFVRPEPPFAHLRGLPDCRVLLVPEHGTPPARLRAQAQWLARLCPGRAAVALTLLHRLDDADHHAAVAAAAAAAGLPVVAAGHVLMHVRGAKPLQDMMTAIGLNRSLDACGFALAPNAEQHLRSRARLAALYPPETLAASVDFVRDCHFTLDALRYAYPREVVPSGQTPASYLRAETLAGARGRFPQGVPAAVAAQIEHELALIAELGYEPYFLTVYDLVQFARRRGILCQGRGSAANSAVCYCLGITEVDPARGNLLFERFISRERNEPPDIDVDFEHQRREEVIQYLYGKYGRDRAALTAVVIRYRPRSALRDAGRALGIDPVLIDHAAAARQWWDEGLGLPEDAAARFGIDPQSPSIRRWLALATALLGRPRHLSQHVGGFVIARDKLSRLVPIEHAAMPERTVIQWDKDDLDALGLLKVDVLALGMLSALHRALDLIAQRRGLPGFTLADIPAEDPATYAMICRADTVGVFQIESRAQQSMLPRLRPRQFYDLVIQVAIVRPGPIQGGMVHPYLRRRQQREPVRYPGPEVAQALSRTLGVPIFQEQVMQVAILAAGFSAGEADQLRRSMAAWKRRGGLGHFHARIIEGMGARGYTREFAEAIFRQIEGFGEYGFPESHAASFALLAYASSWIKCHEPEAFLCALLNSQPMGFYSPSQLVQDARRHGVVVLPVDVAVSRWRSTLEDRGGARPAVRLGLDRIAGMREQTAQRIEAARAQRRFADLDDLAHRAALDGHDLQCLADADALASIAGHRRQARWRAAAARAGGDLLDGVPLAEVAPDLAPASEGEAVATDYGRLGLTLRRHPLALLRGQLAARGYASAAQLEHVDHGRTVRACGLVTVRQRPGTAKGTVFLSLEDETGTVNLIVWPQVFARWRAPLLSARLLGVVGQWQCPDEGRVRHLVVRRADDLSVWLGNLLAPSRDFF